MPYIKFNWVDVVFLTLLIRICYVAFKQGFLPELLKSLGLLIAYFVSVNYYIILNDFITSHTNWPNTNSDILSFCILFFGILIIFKVLAIVIHLFYGKGEISFVSRVIAVFLGFAKGLLLAGLLYTLIVNSPFGYLRRSAEEKSFSGRYLKDIAPITYSICIKLWPGIKNDTPLSRLLLER